MSGSGQSCAGLGRGVAPGLVQGSLLSKRSAEALYLCTLLPCLPSVLGCRLVDLRPRPPLCIHEGGRPPPCSLVPSVFSPQASTRRTRSHTAGRTSWPCSRPGAVAVTTRCWKTTCRRWIQCGTQSASCARLVPSVAFGFGVEDPLCGGRGILQVDGVGFLWLRPTGDSCKWQASAGDLRWTVGLADLPRLLSTRRTALAASPPAPSSSWMGVRSASCITTSDGAPCVEGVGSRSLAAASAPWGTGSTPSTSCVPSA